jgi:hypothetical protein
VPVERLAEEREAIRRNLGQTNDSVERAAAQLGADLERRVRIAGQLFGQLRKVLHDELDELIESGDLGEEHVNEIDRRYEEIFVDWMTDAEGPATVWQRHLEEFEAGARAFLESETAKGEPTSRLVPPEPLDLSGFRSSTDQRRNVDLYTLVQVTGATVSLAGPIAGGVAWMMTSLSAVAIAGPVGAAVGIGISLGLLGKGLKDRDSAIELARTERIEKLNQQADEARTHFTLIAEQQGQMRIDAVIERLAEHRRRLQYALVRFNERIGEPDIVKSRDLVAHLGPYDDEAQQILTELVRRSSNPG